MTKTPDGEGGRVRGRRGGETVRMLSPVLRGEETALGIVIGTETARERHRCDGGGMNETMTRPRATGNERWRGSDGMTTHGETGLARDGGGTEDARGQKVCSCVTFLPFDLMLHWSQTVGSDYWRIIGICFGRKLIAYFAILVHFQSSWSPPSERSYRTGKVPKATQLKRTDQGGGPGARWASFLMGEPLPAPANLAMATLTGKKTCMISAQYSIYSELSNFKAS